MSTQTRWAAILDGDVDMVRKTRDEARADARWLRNHPDVRNRVRYGRGGRVWVARVKKCERTGEWVEVLERDADADALSLDWWAADR